MQGGWRATTTTKQKIYQKAQATKQTMSNGRCHRETAGVGKAAGGKPCRSPSTRFPGLHVINNPQALVRGKALGHLGTPPPGPATNPTYYCRRPLFLCDLMQHSKSRRPPLVSVFFFFSPARPLADADNPR